MKNKIKKYFILSSAFHLFLIGALFVKKDLTSPSTSIQMVELLSLPTDKVEESKQLLPEKMKTEDLKNKMSSSELISFKKPINNIKLKKKSRMSYSKNKVEKNNRQQSSKISFKDKKLTPENNYKANNISKKFTKAKYIMGSINNPHPPYPLLARKYGWQGKLILKVYVKSNGSVENVEIEKSSGYPILDNVSRKTLKNWYFTPARFGDTNVNDNLKIPVRFVLND